MLVTRRERQRVVLPARRHRRRGLAPMLDRIGEPVEISGNSAVAAT